jgi:hypothetical protein
MLRKIRLWQEKHFSSDGYMYIKGKNTYITGTLGTDIKLTFKQKLMLLFSKGVSVTIYGKMR